MATFLQLVNAVGRDSGTLSGTLGTVANASGRWAKAVYWTAEAWRMMQASRADWTFRKKQFSYSLVVDVMEYTPAALGITDFGGWIPKTPTLEPFSIYDPAIGQSDENSLEFKAYDVWFNTYGRGDPDSVRPTMVAISPDRSTLVVGAPPDDTYTLRGWYKREVQELSVDGDTPYIDDEFHDAIKWRAIGLLCEFDEAPFSLAAANDKYRQWHSQLMSEYLPKVEI